MPNFVKDEEEVAKIIKAIKAGKSEVTARFSMSSATSAPMSATSETAR